MPDDLHTSGHSMALVRHVATGKDYILIDLHAKNLKIRGLESTLVACYGPMQPEATEVLQRVFSTLPPASQNALMELIQRGSARVDLTVSVDWANTQDWEVLTVW